ncbi:hypothetical protein B6S44_05685 [Bosea sp. Tri-44]|nr:hypothetical protein B6S44_05685 [Bosea sp. Tri-44]
MSTLLREQAERHRYVKTIISGSTPIELTDLYVNLSLKRDKKIIRDDDLFKLLDTERAILVHAAAGSGKSMLLRYLLLTANQHLEQRFPILIELRDLNSHPGKSFLEIIQECIAEYIDGFSRNQTDFALKSGRLLLILDGFDEIDYDRRREREREVNRLVERYPNLQVIVSSRPDEGNSKWQSFFAYEVQHLSKGQVRLLIDKVPYDEAPKKLFRSKLDTDLFETHGEFLRNPLLTIMMLVMLETFADVPAKIHLFYEYAFEALFQRHDVSKGGGFQRKRRVELALDDYKRLFAYFCATTYMRKLFRFSEGVALECLDQSLKSAQIKADKSGMMRDLVECTCMLVPDGLEFEFSHRSFQEYFFAYFIARIRPNEIPRVMPLLSERSSSDGIVPMVAEMNAEKFEEDWALPQLDLLCKRVVGIDSLLEPLTFINAMFGKNGMHILAMPNVSFECGTGEVFELDHVRVMLYHIYGIFNRIHARLPDESEMDAKVREKILDGRIGRDDPRFEPVRKAVVKSKAQILIKLGPSDNDWVRETQWGRFVAEEAKELVAARDMIRERVRQRQTGLAAILNLSE